jgi:hypothetical protein
VTLQTNGITLSLIVLAKDSFISKGVINMAEQPKVVELKSADVTIDAQGRVVINNPTLKAAVEKAVKDQSRLGLLSNVNCNC